MSYLTPEFPEFNDEFQYPVIEWDRLEPTHTRNTPVLIRSVGAFDEMVLLVMLSNEVILTSVEAWDLMKRLDHWLCGRKVLED